MCPWAGSMIEKVASSTGPVCFTPAARLASLPPYVFVRLDELKAQAIKQGVDLIDLGLGNPDGAAPQSVIEALEKALDDRSTHGYPPFAGHPELKEAIARWMGRRYGVAVDPQEEVLPLVGSKEGLAHLALAYLDHGDLALVPNPCYPVHLRGPLLAGGLIHDLPLTEDTGFLPDLEAVPADVAAVAKVLVLNYPNNPTTAIAPDDLLERSIWFCRRNEILLVHDFAYGELYFDRTRPRSILEFAGGKEVGVEFHTLSKTFNMAGWRIGFAVGNRHVIKTLYALKTNVDYGVFGAIQKAAIAALELPDSELEKIRNTYRQRRDILVEGYNDIGWKVTAPQATIYMWVPVPPTLGMSSREFAEMLLSTTGIVVTPGVAFGSCGEGYLRISMVAPPARLQEAMSRWRKAALTA